MRKIGMGWRTAISRPAWRRPLERLRGKEEPEGLVFNIQKFSIHDGPGIRTTVFLKGCPLSCPWCSNPESINPFPEVITRFDPLCEDCDRCRDACGRSAMKVSEIILPGDDRPIERTRFLDRELCDGCMRCVEVCPTGALSRVGERKTVEEVLEVVEQDRPFYRTSGGGMTLSGGEPLMQHDYALALLREAKKRGLHTALDTCGKAPGEAVAAIIPWVDLVLYDVKHMDPEVHRETVGADNRLILDNLRFLDGRVPIWLRVPVIPGFNDGEENLRSVVELASGLDIEKLCFLPYHRWGSGKYEGLGREYGFEGPEEVHPATLAFLEDLCAEAGVVDCSIASG